MAYIVQQSPAAARQLRKMDRQVQVQLIKAMLKLEENPRCHGVEKLEGRGDAYRLRSGDYRILFTINDEIAVVMVIKFADRKEAY